MTNYNDGKWHGWNGGECPVHPKSEVEVVVQTGDVVVISTSAAGRFFWEEELNPIISFRVVKEHREPREFWIEYDDRGQVQHVFKTKVKRPDGHPFEQIHVREVLE